MGLMAMDIVPDETTVTPRGVQLVGYIEDMLLELAHLASKGGETALAASLAIAAIQAGVRRVSFAPEGPPSGSAHQAA